MVSGIPTASGYEERIRFSEMEVVDRGANEQGLLVNVPEGHFINGWDVNIAAVRTTSVKRNIRYHQHAASGDRALMKTSELMTSRNSLFALSRLASLISTLVEGMESSPSYISVYVRSWLEEYLLRFRKRTKARPHQIFSALAVMTMHRLYHPFLHRIHSLIILRNPALCVIL